MDNNNLYTKINHIYNHLLYEELDLNSEFNKLTRVQKELMVWKNGILDKLMEFKNLIK